MYGQAANARLTRQASGAASTVFYMLCPSFFVGTLISKADARDGLLVFLVHVRRGWVGRELQEAQLGGERLDEDKGEGERREEVVSEQITVARLRDLYRNTESERSASYCAVMPKPWLCCLSLATNTCPESKC
jgi:hypothetical protein